MLTFEEAPWVEYLEIDEETFERKLRSDTPEEIREQYEAYLMEQNRDPDIIRPK